MIAREGHLIICVVFLAAGLGHIPDDVPAELAEAARSLHKETTL